MIWIILIIAGALLVKHGADDVKLSRIFIDICPAKYIQDAFFRATYFNFSGW